MKAYLKFLLNDLGYAGFRYDMVKGYGASYTKLYNEDSKPTFSVGEYWDGNAANVKNWISGTENTSAASAILYAMRSEEVPTTKTATTGNRTPTTGYCLQQALWRIQTIAAMPSPS